MPEDGRRAAAKPTARRRQGRGQGRRARPPRPRPRPPRARRKAEAKGARQKAAGQGRQEAPQGRSPTAEQVVRRRSSAVAPRATVSPRSCRTVLVARRWSTLRHADNRRAMSSMNTAGGQSGREPAERSSRGAIRSRGQGRPRERSQLLHRPHPEHQRRRCVHRDAPPAPHRRPDHAEVHAAGLRQDRSPSRPRCAGSARTPRCMRVDGGTGMGVRFINLSPEASAAINAFLAEPRLAVLRRRRLASAASPARAPASAARSRDAAVLGAD